MDDPGRAPVGAASGRDYGPLRQVAVGSRSHNLPSVLNRIAENLKSWGSWRGLAIFRLLAIRFGQGNDENPCLRIVGAASGRDGSAPLGLSRLIAAPTGTVPKSTG